MMKTIDIDKIAADAAEKIGEATGCSSHEWEEAVAVVIKAFIEKAYNIGLAQGGNQNAS